MVSADVSTRTRILTAATTLFARYGFKRTTMEDIATEAGLSRASLYLQFRNKEDIFRELARDLHEESIAQARAALAKKQPLADRLLRAVEAKTLRMMEIAHASPHGSELMDERNRLCGDVAAAGESDFQEMIATTFKDAADAGEVDLKSAALTPNEAAALFIDASAGLKRHDIPIDIYRSRLAAMVRVFVAGLRTNS